MADILQPAHSVQQFEAATRLAAATVERIPANAQALAEAVARLAGSAHPILSSRAAGPPQRTFRGIAEFPRSNQRSRATGAIEFSGRRD